MSHFFVVFLERVGRSQKMGKLQFPIAFRKPIWYFMSLAIQALQELFGGCIKLDDLTLEHQGEGGGNCLEILK